MEGTMDMAWLFYHPAFEEGVRVVYTGVFVRLTKVKALAIVV
jgi:hypothetical protein